MSDAPRHAVPAVVVAAVAASSALTIMAAAIVAPSLPAMADAFPAAPAWAIPLVLSITSAAIAVGAPVAGVVADRVGAGRVLVVGLLVEGLGGAAGLLAADFGWLLVSRVVLGVGVGAVMTAVAAFIAGLTQGAARARLLSVQTAAASLGAVVLLPLAGLLAESGWRLPFLLYLVALMPVPLVLLALRRTRSAGDDGVDAASNGDRDRLPVLVVARILLLAFAATLVYFMAPTRLPFLVEDLGGGPTLSGIVVAASTASSAVASFVYPTVRRIGHLALTGLAVGLLGAGWLLIGSGGGIVAVIAGALVGGAGVGLVVPDFNVWLSDLSPARLRGRVLSALVAAIFLGQFVSPLVVQPLLDAVGAWATFTYTGVASLAAAAALIVVATVAARRRRPEMQDAKKGEHA